MPAANSRRIKPGDLLLKVTACRLTHYHSMYRCFIIVPIVFL
jgi:hypothetical protein